MYDSKKDNIEYIDDAFILSLKRFANKIILCVLICKFFSALYHFQKEKKKEVEQNDIMTLNSVKFQTNNSVNILKVFYRFLKPTFVVR